MAGVAIPDDSKIGQPERLLAKSSNAKVPLSQQLRKATRNIHSISDSLIAARLVITCTNKRLWAKALGSFWFIHAAIEDALDASKACPELIPLMEFLPRIRRKAAFEADLRTFYGVEWRAKVGQPSSEVQTYLERVKMVAESSPWLLWAHAYTQHMGILVGGQILRRSVRGTMQIIDDEPGTACFELKEPAKTVKEDYKKLMDSMEPVLGEARVRQLIEEHKLIFQLNNKVISSFPVSAGQTVSGVAKLMPPELLILLISIVICLALAWYTRSWVNMDPDSDAFADPDFVHG